MAEPVLRRGFFNPQSTWEPGHLLPDRWRQPLLQRGIDYTLTYSSAFLADAKGGVKRGGEYAGVLEAGISLDAEKVVGWKGANFYVSSLITHGTNFSQRYVGDLYNGSSVHGGAGVRLSEAWFDQSLFQDHFSVRVGQMAADQEFVGTDVGVLFMNGTFGWPSILGVNMQTPNFPIAAPGVRLRADFSQFWVQAAVYTGEIDPINNAGVPQNKHGTRFNLDSRAFVIWEAGYATATEDHPSDYPGVYKVGAWLHTSHFEDLYYDELRQPLSSIGPAGTTQVARERKRNFGWYAVAEQKIWPLPDTQEEQGLSLFARVAGAPSDRNVVAWYLDGGMHFVGLLPGRPRDVTGVGIAYSRISNSKRRFTDETNQNRVLIGDPPFPIDDYESVLEVTHRIEIKPWWYLQPDLQYIMHPGGSAKIPDALILGIGSTISF